MSDQPKVPVAFDHLSAEDRNRIIDALLEADLSYSKVTRERFLDGINRRYIYDRLDEIYDKPGDQLFVDLTKLSRARRLHDGTVPVEQWLRNGVRLLRTLPQREVFEEILDRIAQGDVAVDRVMPAADPPIPESFEEAIVDEIDDLLNASFLAVGARRLPAVAKMHVPRYQKGQGINLLDGTPFIGTGTGWLLSPDLLLTNYHVIRCRRPEEPEPSPEDLELQVRNSRAQFFFDAEGESGTVYSVAEALAVGKSKDRDFALLRLQSPTNGIEPLPIHPEPVVLPPDYELPKTGPRRVMGVNIIQHPGGGPKMVALRNNRVYAADAPRLHYFTDTLSGSSGSPVFDDAWRVIALHRATVSRHSEYNGRQLGYVNEGIQLHAIFSTLWEQAQQEKEQGNPRLEKALESIPDAAIP